MRFLHPEHPKSPFLGGTLVPVLPFSHLLPIRWLLSKTMQSRLETVRAWPETGAPKSAHGGDNSGPGRTAILWVRRARSYILPGRRCGSRLKLGTCPWSRNRASTTALEQKPAYHSLGPYKCPLTGGNSPKADKRLMPRSDNEAAVPTQTNGHQV